MIASAFLTALVLGQAVSTPRVTAGEWKLKGATTEFVMEAAGAATGPKGAVIELRSISNPGRNSGSVTASVPANELRGRRLTLTAELRVGGASEAGLLIHAGSDTPVPLTVENSLADRLHPKDGWTKRSVSIPVPDNATLVGFGVLLQGAGSVSAGSVS